MKKTPCKSRWKPRIKYIYPIIGKVPLVGRQASRCHIRLDYHSGATLHYITSSVTSVAPLLYINSPHPTSNLVTTQPGLYFRFYKARLLIWWRLKVIFNKKKRELEQEIVLCTRKNFPKREGKFSMFFLFFLFLWFRIFQKITANNILWRWVWTRSCGWQ